MKKLLFSLILLLCLGVTGWGQVTISSQDFESTPATPTITFTNTNGAFSTGTNGSGRPTNANLFAGGARGWQVLNATSTLIFANQNLSGYTNCYVEFRLAGMNANTTDNGIDAGDLITVYISVDGGTTYSRELTIGGSAANQYWDFNATGTTLITYDGNDTPTAITSSTGSGGLTTATINIPNVNTQLSLKIAMLNNSANERWVIDDVKIKGTSASSVDNPGSFTATTTSSSQVNLVATANINADNIVVAYNATGTFTTPTDGVAPGGEGSSFAGGTIWYQGAAASLTNHTGLTANTTYYYKAFSYDGSNNYSTGLTANATTAKIEPTNQITNFAKGSVTTTTLPLTWTAAAAGSQTPDGYLLKLTTTTISDPVDGTDPGAGSLVISSGNASYKVTSAATTSATFTGGVAGTMYTINAYSYTNSGTLIDFKLTDIPSINVATLPTAVTGSSLSASSTTTANISWSAASGYNTDNHSTLVFVKAGSSITTGTPSSAPSVYTANSVFSTGTAYQNDALAYCVYNGDGTNVSISGLSANTSYYYLIYTVVDASNTGSTNSYSSAITGNGATAKIEPTNQITNFAKGSITTTTLPLTWTAAAAGSQSPDGYLLKLTTTTISDPVDGTDPGAGSLVISSGNVSYKVTSAATTSATFTGGVAGTMYTINAYSYTNSGTLIDFKLSDIPSINVATLPNAVSGASLSAASTITANISWSAASGYITENHSTLVFVKAGSSITAGTPSSAPSVYTANTVFTTGTAYQNDALAYCVYNGDGTNVSISGLSANTSYYYLIYTVVDATNTGSTNSYSSAITGNGATAKIEPTNQITNFAKGSVTTTTLPLTWTAAVAGSQSPDGYLLKLSTTTISDPVDGTDPGAGSLAISSGSASYKVTSAATTSATFTGGVAGTMYTINAYSYTNSGTLIDFKTSGIPTINVATLPNPVTSGNVASTGYSTANISWSAASGYDATNHTTLVFLKETSAVTTGTPTNAPSFYAANTVFASGTSYQNDASAYCVYKGDGTNVSVSGLAANTTYHLLIYTLVDASNYNSTNSYSSGATANGTTDNLSAPTANAATSIKSTGFTANWDAGIGASSYRLDVSTQSTFTTPAPATFTEGFETGLTGQYQTGNVTMGSGVWSVTNVMRGSTGVNSGTYSAQLQSATGSQLTSPVIPNAISSISFYVTSSTASGAIQVNYSTNGGSSWSAVIGSPFTGLTTSKTQITINNLSITGSEILIQFYRSAATIYLDDILINYTGSTPSLLTGYNNLTVNSTTQSVSGLNPGTNYYYRVRAVGGNSTSTNSGTITTTTDASPASASFAGTNSNEWEDVGNWDTDIPGSTTDVIIPSDKTVVVNSNNHECNNLIIAANGNLTINSGKDLLANGAFLIQSNSSGTGSLLDNGTLAATSYTVQRYVPAATWTDWKDGWHALSSPVSTQAVSGFTEATATDYDIYSWYEPGNVWVNYKNTDVAPTWNTANTIANGLSNDAANFLVGKAYLVSYKNNVTKSFVGNLNTSDVSITGLDISGAGSNSFHLLGNPFPSALLWDAGWTKSNIAATAQVWSEALQDYASVVYGDYIPSMNGFIVEATSDGASLTIPAAKRAHNATSWYKNQTTNLHTLKLTILAADGGSGKETIIRFDPMSTTAFDKEFDGSYLQGYGPVFYSNAGDLQLSVNTLPSLTNNTEIPLTFVRNQATDFELLAEGLETIPADVYLNDLKTGTSQNLRLNPVYSFNSSDSDSPDRFKLTFGAVGIGESENQNSLQAYVYGNRVYVTNTLGKAMMQLFDLQGRLVQSSQLNGDGLQSQALNLPAGVYVLRLSNAYSVKSEKVVIGE